MRSIIHKILKEEVEKIKRNEQYIGEVLPGIIGWINEKYGRGITVKHRKTKTHYGSDNYTGNSLKLMIYIEDSSLEPTEVKHEIWEGLNNFFNIDPSKYGSGIEIEVFVKHWVRV